MISRLKNCKPLEPILAGLKKNPKPKSRGEESLALQLMDEGIHFEREYRFSPPRRWRLDFVLGWPNHFFAIEVEGGSWINGAHNRGKRFEQDAEKYAEALIKGYKVLRVTSDMVFDGRAMQYIIRAIQQC